MFVPVPARSGKPGINSTGMEATARGNNWADVGRRDDAFAKIRTVEKGEGGYSLFG